MYVIFLQSNGNELIEDAEMLGPFIITCLFILAMRLRSSTGMLTFYSVFISGNLILNSLVNLLTSNENSSKISPHDYNNYISVYKLTSLLSYCQLPIIIFSYLSVLFTLKSALGLILSLSLIIFCSYSATNILAFHLRIKDKDILLFYPILIYYAFYILMLL